MNRRQTRFLSPVLHPSPMRTNAAASPSEQRAQRFTPGSAEYRHVEPVQWDEYAGPGHRSPWVPLEDVGRGTRYPANGGGYAHVDNRRDSGYRGPRPSYSISNFGRGPTAAGFPLALDRSSERTDEMVRAKIDSAMRAAGNRSSTINVGKLMKISLPKYYGGEAIDTYLKFLREILLYFVNYNMMTPDADAHRVSVLGSALEERALKWYQQTIHMNADGRWSFEGAMIELKRHFVKDASARDAAAKYDRLTQQDRTVTNLRKELEGLTMQMVEVPTEYDMSRQFMKALKPEIASAVARYGVNPENSGFDAIFETAKSIEQGIYYEESQ